MFKKLLVKRWILYNARIVREIAFVLASVTIVIVSFFLLNTFTLQNITVAKNLIATTTLAQEGINAVLDIQDQNTALAITVGSNVYAWAQLFDGALFLTSCDRSQDPTSNCFDLKLFICNLGNPPKKEYCLSENSTSYTDPSWKIQGSEFFRKVRITNGNDTNTKTVTVLVWWSDSKGLHKSVLTRNVTKGNAQ